MDNPRLLPLYNILLLVLLQPLTSTYLDICAQKGPIKVKLELRVLHGRHEDLVYVETQTSNPVCDTFYQETTEALWPTPSSHNLWKKVLENKNIIGNQTLPNAVHSGSEK